jgi:hypothetical protein
MWLGSLVGWMRRVAAGFNPRPVVSSPTGPTAGPRRYPALRLDQPNRACSVDDGLRGMFTRRKAQVTQTRDLSAAANGAGFHPVGMVLGMNW